MRLRYGVSVGPSSRETKALHPDTEVTFAPMEALADGVGGLDTSKVRSLSEVASGSYNFFSDGDLLLAKVTPCFENGKKALAQGLSNGIGYATSEVHVIRPRTDAIDRRYLLYMLSSETFRAEGMRSMTGAGGLRRVSENAILNFRLPVADLLTQKSVAAFLDRETARINQLIEKKQRLVELTAEKLERTTEQIASGTDDSSGPHTRTGIDWLPSVPEGWLTGKLFWLFRPAKGKDAQKYTKEYCATIPGPYPVFSGQTADGGVMGEIDSYDYDVGERGCLFATTVGAKAMSLRHVTRRFSLSQNCMILTPRTPAVHVRFYLHHLQALFRRERELIPKHMQPSFRVEDMRRYRVATVPPEEAEARARLIDREHMRLEPLRQRVERSIDRLKEYRSALITAAVTGQIDVGTWSRRGEGDRRLDRIEEEMAG